MTKPTSLKKENTPFRPSKERLPRIEFFQSPQDSLFYFRLVSTNGQIVLQGPGHKKMSGAKKSIQVIEKCIIKGEKIILNHKKKKNENN